MQNDLIFEGKKFISSRRAAQFCGYTQDYIGQLIRGRKVDARMVGRSWFVSEESLISYKAQVEEIQKQKSLSEGLPKQDISPVENTIKTSIEKQSIETVPVSSSPNEVEESRVSLEPEVYTKNSLVKKIAELPLGENPSASSLAFATLGKKALVGALSLSLIAGSLWVVESKREKIVVDDTNRSSLAAVVTAPAPVSYGALELIALGTYETLHPLFDGVGNVIARLFSDDQSKTLVIVPSSNTSRTLSNNASTTDDAPVLDAIADLRQEMNMSFSKVFDGISSILGQSYRSSGSNVTTLTSTPNPSGVTSLEMTSQLASVYSILQAQINRLVGTSTITTQNVRNARDANVTAKIVGSNISDSVITGSTFSGSSVRTDLLTVTGMGTTTILGTSLFDTDSLVIDAVNHRIGVGTTSPYEKLSVSGNFVADAIFGVSTSATSTFAGGLTLGTSGLVYQGATKNVGFGTTSPLATLDILQSANGTPIISAYRITDTAPTGDFINYRSRAGTTLFRVDNSGNLLAGGIINTGSQTVTSITGPQFRVQYDGSNEITTTVSSSGTTTLAVSGTTPSLVFTPQANRVTSFQFTDASEIPVLSIDTQNRRVGISTSSPRATLHVDGTDGLIIPSGTTGQRSVSPYIGTIRYNTSTSQFEGYSGSTWGSLGGLIDVDQDTYVSAEDTPGADNDQLKFLTAGAQRMVVDTNGNVGVGTTSPLARLTVANFNGGSTPLFFVASSTGSGATTTNFIVDAYGNVGVNTTSGTLNTVDFGGGVFAVSGRNTNTNGNVQIIGNNLVNATGVIGRVAFTDNTAETYTNVAFIQVNRGGTNDSGEFLFQTKSAGGALAERMRITSTGNVGIGTTTPWALTSINPNGIAGPSFAIGSSTKTDFVVTNAGRVGVGTADPTTPFHVVTNGLEVARFVGSSGGVTTGYVHFYDGPYEVGGVRNAGGPVYAMDFFSAGGRPIYITPSAGYNTSFTSGNVGIGTTSPFAKLSVAGDAYIGGNLTATGTLAVSGTASFGTTTVTNLIVTNTSTSTFAGPISNTSGSLVVASGNASNLLLNPYGGNVGIGTANPQTRLDIKNGTVAIGNTGDFDSTLEIRPAGGVSPLDVRGDSNQAGLFITYTGAVGVKTITPISALDVSGGVSIGSYGGVTAAPTNGLIVSGNVGIGTTSPFAKLSVAGDAYIGGNVTATGTIRIADGTVTAPSLSFASQPALGIYRSSANVLSFAGYNSTFTSVPVLSLNTFNNTVSLPSATNAYRYSLEVNGGTTPAIIVGSSGNTGFGSVFLGSNRTAIAGVAEGGWLRQDLYFLLSGDTVNQGAIATTSDAKMVIKAVTGNVGIGTTSPFAKLSVAGDAYIGGNLTATGTLSANAFNVTGTGTTTFAGDILARGIAAWQYLTAPTLVATSTTGTSTFAGGITAPGNFVLQSSSGKIGLGTTGSLLHRMTIGGGTQNIAFEFAPGVPGSGIGYDTSVDNGQGGIVFRANSGSSDFNTTVMTIGRNEPKVGIGTTTPSARLAVTSGGTGTGRAFVVADSNNVDRAYITDNGTLTLCVPGSGCASFFSQSGGLNINSPGVGNGILVNDYLAPQSDLGSNLGHPTQAGGRRWNTSYINTGIFYNTLSVGTTSPWGVLSIASANRTTGAPLFVIASSSAAVSTTTPFIVTATGNVGIGLANPSYLVDAGEVTNTSARVYSFLSTSGGQEVVYAGNDGSGKGVIRVKDGPAAYTRVMLSGNESNAGVHVRGNAEFLRFTSSGGSDLFRVFGDGSLVSTVSVNNSFAGTLGIGSSTPWGKLSVTNTGSGPSFVVEDSTSPDSTPFIVDASGNVGIGVTAPVSRLQIAGDVPSNPITNVYAQLELTGSTNTAKRLSLGYNTTSNYGVIQPITNGVSFDNLIVNPSGGDIGIGTTLPRAKLDITNGSANINGHSSNGLNITALFNGLSNPGNANLSINTSDAQATGIGGSIGLGGLYRAGVRDNTSFGVIRSGKTNSTDGDQSGYLSFSTNDASTISERMRITNTGNVGIATTSPFAKLSVAGDAYIGGNLTATGTLAVSGTASFGTTTVTNLIVTNTSTSTFAGGLTVGGSSGLVYQQATGNVGINTSTPGSKLDVNGLTRILSATSIPSSGSGLELFYSAGAGTVQAYNRTGSNYLPLYLEGSAVILNSFSNGSVGIGSSTPWGKFSVTNTSANPSFVVEDSTSPDSTPFIVDASGNVGIGTVSPTYTLDVSGSARLRDASYTYMTVGGNEATFGSASLNAYLFTPNYGAPTLYGANGITLNNASNNGIALQTGGTTRMFLTQSGNVGIGTTSPSQILSVQGNALVSGNLSVAGITATGTISAPTITSSSVFTANGSSQFNDTVTISNDTDFHLVLQPSAVANPTIWLKESDGTSRTYFGVAGGNGQLNADSSKGDTILRALGGGKLLFSADNVNALTQFVILPSGNVGIGTTSPFAKLSVAGDAYIGGNVTATGTLAVTGAISAPYFTATNALATSTYAGGITGPGNFTVQQSSGRVGVGITNPAEELDVIGTVQASSDFRVATNGSFRSNNSTGGNITLASTTINSPTFTFNTNSAQTISASSGNTPFVSFRPGVNQTGSASYTALLINPTETTLGSGTSYLADFQTSGVSRFNVTNTGNVGIGTTSPFAKLSVAGDAYIGGNLTATGTLAVSGTASFGTTTVTNLIVTNTSTSTFAGSIDVNNVGTNATSTIAGNLWVKGTLRTGTGSLYLNDTSLTAGNGGFQLNTTGNSYVNAVSGNFGIASSSPAYRFSIGSPGSATSGVASDGDNIWYTYQGDQRFNLSSNGTAALGLPSGHDGGALSLASGNAKSIISGGGSGQANLRFFTGNDVTTAKMSILSGGNVGIGTTTPAAKLTVIQSTETNASTGIVVYRSTNDSQLWQGYNTTADAWQIAASFGVSGAYKPITLWTSGIERFRVDSAGNVGIGTTSPQQKLEIYSSSADAAIRFDTHSRIWTLGGKQSDDSFRLSSSALGTGDLITATVGGNVGIGSTSPMGKLAVAGSGFDPSANYNAALVLDGAYGGGIVFEDTAYSGIWARSNGTNLNFSTGGTGSNFGSTVGQMVLNSSGNLTVAYASTTAQTVSGNAYFPGSGIWNSSGYVGIGTSTPGYRLDVVGRMRVQGGGGNGGGVWLTTNSAPGTDLTYMGRGNDAEAFTGIYTNSSWRFVVADGGNVGIGTTTPGAKLQVTADANTSGAPQNAQLFVTGATTPTERLSIAFNTSSNYGELSAETSAGVYVPILLNPNGGNIGIGTTTANNTLSIWNRTGSEASARITGSGVGGAARQAILYLTSGSNENRARGVMADSQTGALTPWYFGVPYSADAFTVGRHATQAEYPANSLFYITSGGSVGIGTTTPTARLSLSGGGVSLGNNNGIGWRYNNGGVEGTLQGVINYDTSNRLTLEGGSDIVFGTNVLSLGNFPNAGVEKMRITAGGSIGIGTTTPSDRLQIYNASGQGVIGIDSVSGSNSVLNFREASDLKWQVYNQASDDAFIIRGNSANVATINFSGATANTLVLNQGSVGIGTTTPTRKLSVGSGGIYLASGSNDTGIIVDAGAGWATDLLASKAGGSNVFRMVQYDNTKTLYLSTDATTTYDMKLSTALNAGRTLTMQGSNIDFQSADTPYPITMRVTGDKVGIGTTSPFAKLSVAGDAYIGGNLTATGTLAVSGASTFSGILNVLDVYGTGSGGLLRLQNRAFSTGATAVQVLGANAISNSSGQFTGLAIYPALSQTGSASYTALLINPTETTLGSGTSYLADFQTGGVSRFNVTNTGNVGIGTTSPYAKLSVVGPVVAQNFVATSTSATSTIAGGLDVGGGAMRYDFSSGVTTIDNLEIGNTFFESDAGIITWADLPVTSASANGVVNSYSASINGNPLLTLYSTSDGAGNALNQNVGIGSSTPWGKLAINPVAGDVNQFVVGSSTRTSFIINPAGNVGIGTTSPIRRLSVVGEGGTNVNGIAIQHGTEGSTWAFDVGGSGNSFTGGLGFSRNGSAQMVLTSSGNAGIGTTSPDELLTISKQNTGGFTGLRIKNDDTNSASTAGIKFTVTTSSYNSGEIGAARNNGNYLYFNADGTTRMVVGGNTLNGNVGIGTTTPQKRLSVVGDGINLDNGTAENGLYFTTAGGTARMQLYRATSQNDIRMKSSNGGVINSGDIMTWDYDAGNVGVATNTPWGLFSINPDVAMGSVPSFVIGSSTATRFVVNNAGQVGIGTAAPITALHVSAVAPTIRLEDTNTTIKHNINGTGGVFSLTADTGNGAVGSRAITFNLFNTEYARLGSTGNFGVGTTTPWAQLSVNPNGLTGPSFVVGSSTKTDFIVTNAGNVGIGTSNPASRLTLEGGSFFQAGGSVTSSSTPTIVGGVKDDSLLAIAQGVFVSGRYAYAVAATDDSLRIIDVSNPAAPVIVGGVKDASLLNSPISVAVANRYAYVANNVDNSLRIIDVSNPAAPVIVGGVKDNSLLAGAQSVSVSGRYAYVANNSDSSLRIIDVSNPASPVIVGGVKDVSLLQNITSVTVLGRYAYVTNFTDDSLRVIDVSNPAAPVIVGGVKDISLLDGPTSVSVSGRYAYVAVNNNNSLRIIDVSNPAAPVIVGGVKNDSLLAGAQSVSVSGRYAYMTNFTDDSLRIIDVSNPASPVIVGGVKDVSLLNGAVSVVISGRYAYVANANDSSLRVIDISGIEAQSALVHSLEAGTLQTQNNVLVGNNLLVSNGLNVGNDAMIGGTLTVSNMSSTTLSNFNPVAAVFLRGNVGIGTTTPYAKLSVAGEIVGSLITATTTGFRAPDGSVSAPAYSFTSDSDLGITRFGTNAMGFVTGGYTSAAIGGTGAIFTGNSNLNPPPAAESTVHIATNDQASAGTILTIGLHSTNSKAPEIRAKKSQGQYNAATAITTGDDLFKISGYGYVGGTNTYQEATQILFDSTGTISDSATGIAGVIRFLTANTGSEPAERMTILNSGNVGIGTTSPWAQLSVNPNGLTGPSFAIGSSTKTDFVVTNGGNVGIGTTSPSTKLHVSGTDNNGVRIDASTVPSLKLQRTNSTGATGNIDWIGSTNVIGARIGVNDDIAGSMQFKLGGTGVVGDTKMIITSAGNVGIGTTTNTAYRLTVTSGTTKATASTINVASFGSNDPVAASDLLLAVRQGGSATQANRWMGIQSYESAYGAQPLVLQDLGGNVGIGTTTPSSKLHVYGSSAGIRLTDTSMNLSGIGMVATRDGTSHGIGLVDYNGGTNYRLSIDSTGNVGIGTTSPIGKVEIVKDGVYNDYTASGINITTASNPQSQLRMGYDLTADTAYLQAARTGVATKPISLNAQGGNVAIGTSSPTTKLHVWGQALFGFNTGAQDVKGGIYVSSGTGAGGARQYWIGASNPASHNNNMFQITDAPTVGSDTSSNKLLTIQGAHGTTGQVQFNQYGAGTLVTDSSGVITASSDVRLKDVQGEFDRGLDALMAIEPILYKWNASTTNEQVNTYAGFSAQNIQTSIPEAVGVDPRGYLTLQDRPILATIVNAVKNIGSVVSVSDAPTTTPSLYIDASGNIGIGTTTPGYKLHVIGDVAAQSFVNISTRTSKKDIEYLDEEAKISILDKIRTVGIATYRYNTESETDAVHLGLIAEEAPVDVLATGGKGVDIYKLSTFILAGVQEQQGEIEMLQARFASLDTTVANLASTTASIASTTAELTARLDATASLVATLLAQASSTASTTPVETTQTIVWSSDIGAQMLSFLQSVGLRIENGIAYIQGIVSDVVTTKKLTVGDSANLAAAGVTILDRATGQPACVYIENSIVRSEGGACGALPTATSDGSPTTPVVITDPAPAPIVEIIDETATSTSTTDTTVTTENTETQENIDTTETTQTTETTESTDTSASEATPETTPEPAPETVVSAPTEPITTP